MTDLRAIVGQNVRAARLAQGPSQSQLAKLAGVSPLYLSEIEHGRANVRLKIIERLALALGTTPAVLAARVPDKL